MPSTQREQTPAPTLLNQTEDDARRIARALHGAGMGGPARIVLDAFKPLHWIAGQFIWALQPFLGAFGPFSKKGTIDSMAQLLEREGGVAELTGHLDTLLEEQQTTTAGAERARK